MTLQVDSSINIFKMLKVPFHSLWVTLFIFIQKSSNSTINLFIAPAGRPATPRFRTLVLAPVGARIGELISYGA
eukprot:SAG31_NODE_306_length_17979_cov_7.825447_15_plen_74_part_00